MSEPKISELWGMLLPYGEKYKVNLSLNIIEFTFRTVISARTTRLGNNNSNGVTEMLSERLQSQIYDLESECKTVVTVYFENKFVGLIAVADTLRQNAKYVIDEIKNTIWRLYL